MQKTTEYLIVHITHAHHSSSYFRFYSPFDPPALSASGEGVAVISSPRKLRPLFTRIRATIPSFRPSLTSTSRHDWASSFDILLGVLCHSVQCFIDVIYSILSQLLPLSPVPLFPRAPQFADSRRISRNYQIVRPLPRNDRSHRRKPSKFSTR